MLGPSLDTNNGPHPLRFALTVEHIFNVGSVEDKINTTLSLSLPSIPSRRQAMPMPNSQSSQLALDPDVAFEVLMCLYCWDSGLTEGNVRVSSELKAIKASLVSQCSKGDVAAFENTCFKMFAMLRSKPTLTADEKAEFVDLLWLAFGMYESYVTIEVLLHSDQYNDSYFRSLLVRLVNDVLREQYLPSPIIGPLRGHLEDLETRMSASLANASSFQTEQNDLMLSQELDFWMAMLDPVESSKGSLGAGGLVTNSSITGIKASGSNKLVVDISGLKRKLSAPNIQVSTSRKLTRPLGGSQSLSLVTSSSKPGKHVAALKRTFSMSTAVPQPRKMTRGALTPVPE